MDDACQGRKVIQINKKKLEIIGSYEGMNKAENFKKDTLELQEDKMTASYPCLNAFFQIFKLINVFNKFLKEGMCPNVGHIKGSD